MTIEIVPVAPQFGQSDGVSGVVEVVEVFSSSILYSVFFVKCV